MSTIKLPLIFKHRMNDASIKDQLKLFKSTLPSPNNCPKSVNAVYDYILKDREEYIKRFYFCKTCQNIVTDKECNICRSENIYFLILDVVYIHAYPKKLQVSSSSSSLRTRTRT